MKLDMPDFGKLLTEAANRKEEWSWDGIVPARDVTLVAAFMKKGKTTLLTGYVNAVLRTGFYCGLGTAPAKRVLYMAPEEGDTLLRRFHRLGFETGDGAQICVLPRGHDVWTQLVEQYRMRNWPSVVEGFQKAGFDHVICDGLHTLLQMFEPQAKEDNEGVGRFMANFILPFGSDFTVVCSLHTKKAGGDPKVHIPPEEMIRGASAWMAHPGQILVLEHDRKADLKTFHCFGRYETSKAQGLTIRYDEKRRDYVALVDEAEDSEALAQGTQAETVVRAKVMHVLNNAHGAALSTKNIQAMVTQRHASVAHALVQLEEMGMVRRAEKKNPSGRKSEVWSVVSSYGSEI
jgi:hypothetical protein